MARCELAIMRILMAVPAAFMPDRPMEIIALVALIASHLGMLSDQAKLGHVMIEHGHRAILLPAIGGMAAFTLALDLDVLEGIVVRILVAALAPIE